MTDKCLGRCAGMTAERTRSLPADASHFRHSRECGNPSWTPLRWIPAFAGMTDYMFGAVRVDDELLFGAVAETADSIPAMLPISVIPANAGDRGTAEGIARGDDGLLFGAVRVNDGGGLDPSGRRFPFPSFPRMRESIVDTAEVDPRFRGDDGL